MRQQDRIFKLGPGAERGRGGRPGSPGGPVNDVPSALTRTIGQIPRPTAHPLQPAAGLAAGRHPGRGPLQDAPFGLRGSWSTRWSGWSRRCGQADPDRLEGGQRPLGLVVRDGRPSWPSVRSCSTTCSKRPPATSWWSTARCWRRPGWRSTRRCSPASPSRQPGRPATGCCRAASWPPAAAATGPPRWAGEAYAVRLSEEARRFTLARSELRAGVDQILKYVTWALLPTAALLFYSQLRLDHGIRAG